MSRTLLNIAYFGLVATLFDIGPAWAYLDPGTGSMMLQALIGGIAGAIVVGKLYWHRLREFVSSRFSGKSSESVSASRAHAASRLDKADD